MEETLGFNHIPNIQAKIPFGKLSWLLKPTEETPWQGNCLQPQQSAVSQEGQGLWGHDAESCHGLPPALPQGMERLQLKERSHFSVKIPDAQNDLGTPGVRGATAALEQQAWWMAGSLPPGDSTEATLS